MKARCSLNVLALLFVCAISACGQEGPSHKAAEAIDQLAPVGAIDSAASAETIMPSLTVDVIPPPQGTVYLVRFNLTITGVKGPLFVSLTTFGECDFHPVLNLDLIQPLDHTTKLTGYVSLDVQDCASHNYHALLSIDKRDRSISVTSVDFSIGR